MRSARNPAVAGAGDASRRVAARIAVLALLGAAGIGVLAGIARAQPRAAAPRAAALPPYARAPVWYPPLAHPPLDPPLRLSGTFGEYRTGHFHAGVDLSTDEQPGRPVYASLDGHVVRVRASGVGYGRSVYLQAADGRLLVYGHLDAFDEPLASYVDSVQRATGQYEQDLWPDSARFAVTAGRRLGWSGRSGTGPPHLHFEIRRGDMAYNPLLAGLEIPDTSPAVLRRLTVEPLPGSAIRGREGPMTYDLETAIDTVWLFGAARVALEAEDKRANGQLTMAPWRLWMTPPDSAQVECRFDSVSWADGMSEVDEVYDRGRTAPDGAHAIRLWAPAGFRPGPIHAVQSEGEAGVLRPDTVAIARQLVFEVRDTSPYRVVRHVWLSAWTPPPAVRESLAAPGAPWKRIRGRCTHAAAAVLDRQRSAFRRVEVAPGHALHERLGEWTLDLPANAPFEAEEAGLAALPAPAAAGELAPAGPACALVPDLLPLRVPLVLRVAGAKRGPGTPPGIYRETEEGWEWVPARIDSASGDRVAESRHGGRFAQFRDGVAPAIELHAPPRRPPEAPYPRWALEAALEDKGSGVAARDSRFEIDGVRVPSEWDPEVGTLRWTPRQPPPAGRHRLEVIATDRAGNRRRVRGSFVLDSTR